MLCNEALPGKRNKAVRYKGRESQPWLSFFAGIAQHVPSETPHECDELVKVLRAGPAECCADHDNKEPERVLLPLDIPVQLPTSSEETILHDPHSREQLEWHGKQNRERIEELHGLCEARRRVKVLDDNRIDVRSEGEIRKCTSAAKEDLT